MLITRGAGSDLVPGGRRIGLRLFFESVSNYSAGGAIPVLALFNLKAHGDGVINSTVLSYLAGQKLQFARSAMDDTDMMRWVVRVVHDFALNGQISEARRH